MAIHNLYESLGRALATGDCLVANPGTGIALDLRGMDKAKVVLSAGTYLLPAVAVGTELTVIATGNVTIQNAAASQLMVLTSGEAGYFVATTTSTWRGSQLDPFNVSTLAGIPYTYDGAATAFTGTDAQSALSALLQSASNLYVPVPLLSLRIMSTMAVGTLVITDATPDTGGAGTIGSTTTPILEPINGATTGCQRLNWASSNNTVVGFQIPLPSNLDDARDITISTRIASGGTTNAVGFTVTSYFGETGAAVSDTSGTNQTTTYSTASTTIAAADVPAGARTMTVTLTPVAHTTDALHLSAVEVTVPRNIPTF